MMKELFYKFLENNKNYYPRRIMLKYIYFFEFLAVVIQEEMISSLALFYVQASLSSKV